MLTREQINAPPCVNIGTTEKEKLDNIIQIQLDNSLSKNQRTAYIFELTKNPYICYEDIGVKIELPDNIPSSCKIL